MDGKRVHGALKLVRQCPVYHAMPFDPALSPESLRHDIEPEMTFTARAMSGMAFMQMQFVFDMQAFRRESRDELRRDNILHPHDRFLIHRKLSPQSTNVNNRNACFCGLSSLEAAIDATA